MSEDRTADFESTTLPYLRDLFSAAVGMIGDLASAEDLVQEVYLRAWRSFRTYRPGSNCRAWLYKILANCVHDHRRRWLNTMFVAEDPEVLEESLPCTPPMPDGITDQEILEAIGGLPLDYRKVLVLADVEEFAYKEIAAILDVPIGTVMSRLSRARRILRHRLAEVAESYGIGTECQRGVHA